LKAALFQNAARRRIADARTGLQGIVLKIAKCVIDHSAHSFGGIAAIPIRHAEPIAELGGSFARLDTAHADDFTFQHDGERRFALLPIDRAKKLLGVRHPIRMRNTRGILRDAAIVDETCDGFPVRKTRRAQHEPLGLEDRNATLKDTLGALSG
jgi:hypothetical protein